MGLGSAIVAKVKQTAVDVFYLVTTEIYPKYTVESRAVHPPGFESSPVENDRAVVAEIGSQGKTGFLGILTQALSPNLKPGEVRIYSRDSDGNLTTTIYMRDDKNVVIDVNGTQIWIKDGEIALGEENPGDNLALASKTKSNDDALANYDVSLKTYLDTHTHGTGVGPSGPPLVPSPATPTVQAVKSTLITAK
jgi:hypothetical protein